MIDYTYTECTSAALQALSLFSASHPSYRNRDVSGALDRMEAFLKKKQRSDGSWEGCWGVCFTYGTWFGLEGLAARGYTTSHPAVERACQFLLEKQNGDGGWGEDFRSCTERR